MNEDTAHRIVNAILNDLEGRSGFDHWWDDVEEDIQDEIRDDLTAVVMSAAPADA